MKLNFYLKKLSGLFYFLNRSFFRVNWYTGETGPNFWLKMAKIFSNYFEFWFSINDFTIKIARMRKKKLHDSAQKFTKKIFWSIDARASIENRGFSIPITTLEFHSSMFFHCQRIFNKKKFLALCSLFLLWIYLFH